MKIINKIIFVFLFQLIGCSPFSINKPVEILSWNVQNLFDGSVNGGEYPEFNPATGNWSESLFHDRLENLSYMIKESCGFRGPDVLILQEIENKNCIEQLNKYYLASCGYRNRYVSNNESGIQVAVLTRCNIIRVKSHRINKFPLPRYPLYRDILEVEIKLPKSTIIIFVNHWKSKSGGAIETEPRRIKSANFLMNIIKERRLNPDNQDKGIIICGDLNENHDEFELYDGKVQCALMPFEIIDLKNSVEICPVPISYTSQNVHNFINGYPVFYSPWEDDKSEKGSYFYDDSWETIDHFLLDSEFFNNRSPIFSSFELIDDECFLSRAGLPQKWISRFKSGYSDHLPILLRLD